MKSVIEGIVKGLSSHFDTVKSEDKLTENIDNDVIYIASKNYFVILKKKSDEDDTDGDTEKEDNQKEEKPVTKNNEMDVEIDKGKRLTVNGTVKVVEDKYISISLGKNGSIELYMPIKGFEVGEKVQFSIKRNNG